VLGLLPAIQTDIALLRQERPGARLAASRFSGACRISKKRDRRDSLLLGVQIKANHVEVFMGIVEFQKEEDHLPRISAFSGSLSPRKSPFESPTDSQENPQSG